MKSAVAAPYAVVAMGQELAHDSTSIGAVTLSILKREGNRFLALSKEVHSSCEPEAIHQMRVTTRRIQMAIKALGDFLPAQYAVLRKDLKKPFQALGAVRDFDVDIEQLTEACPESHARRTLIKALKSERDKKAAELLGVLDAPGHGQLLERLRDLTSLSVDTLPKRARRGAVKVAPKVIQKRYQKLDSQIRKIDATSAQEQIHELRKKSKGFRYLIEFFVDVYGKPAKDIVKEFKCLQDDLGAYVDARVAIQMLERLRTTAALDEGSRELVKDLIEMYSLRADEALCSVPKARKTLKGKAWKKMRRKMADVRKAGKGQPLLVVASRANGHLKTAG